METNHWTRPRNAGRGLETFLGGMETEVSDFPSMEFLWALKPSLVEWKLLYMKSLMYRIKTLETFLGGMETSFHDGGDMRRAGLETFLGGMETSELGAMEGKGLSLKPSLVEWKLGIHHRTVSLVRP